MDTSHCKEDHREHAQCRCGGCVFRWPGYMRVECYGPSGNVIHEAVCEKCLMELAEFFHPSLLQSSVYISTKDQLRAYWEST